MLAFCLFKPGFFGVLGVRRLSRPWTPRQRPATCPGRPAPSHHCSGKMLPGVPIPGPRLAQGGVVRRPPTDRRWSACRTWRATICRRNVALWSAFVCTVLCAACSYRPFCLCARAGGTRIYSTTGRQLRGTRAFCRQNLNNLF